MKKRVKVTDELRMQRIRNTLLHAQQHAALYVLQCAQGINSDSKQLWKDSTVQARYNLRLAEVFAAGERAKQVSAAPRVFGVVMMQARIEDPKQWEQMHADVADGKAIDVEAVPAALPPKEGTGG